MPNTTIREATEADLSAVVRLLADDFLGAEREVATDPLPAAYLEAFREVAASPATFIYVMELDGRVMGTMQLSFLPGLSNLGARRMDIEAVRIDSALRGQRHGERLIAHAVDLARGRGCRLVQLTSNKQRDGAHRFYTRLGFKNSHEGFKLSLD